MSTPKQRKLPVKSQPTVSLGLNFWITEFFVFLSQVTVIYLVAFLISDMFGNEERLTEFVTSKLNTNTITELGLTLFAATFVMGFIAIVTKIIPSGDWSEKIANEVLLEFPRTIYLFGSSVTAATAAIATFMSQHPQAINKPAGYFYMAAFFAISFFTYGAGLKAMLILGLSRKKNG